ncbi:MAG: SDR family oxidoreductase [Rhodothermus sp.]|nr:SDR family oxidoreductase [Rhodothermus sp.]
MKTFKHKTILITGASSGIGEAMAYLLRDPSVRLLLAARSEHKLQAMAETLQRQGVRAQIYPCDLSRPGAAESLFQRITSEGHRVDVLINNAGVGKYGRFDQIRLADTLEILRLNIENLVALTHLCIPHMLERGDAGILNVASTAGFQGIPYMSVYAATKSFVITFSEALYAEYANRGITVTCLCPGPTATAFQERAGMPVEGMRRLMESPEKVARAGLRALLRGELLHISGIANAIVAHLSQLTPRRMRLAITRQLLGPADDF